MQKIFCDKCGDQLTREVAKLCEALENIVSNGDLTMYASKELIWKWLKDSQRIAREVLRRVREAE